MLLNGLGIGIAWVDWFFALQEKVYRYNFLGMDMI